MYKHFNPVRGFFAMDQVCSSIPAGTTVSQFIPGLFSIVDYAGTGNAIPLIGQGVAAAVDSTIWGINTLHTDAPRKAYSSAASISGTVLTVGGTVSGTWAVGDKVFVSGAVGPTGLTITSLGTGTGGAGTYNLSGSASISATTMFATQAGITGVTLQDEIDFFVFNDDSRARFLIDGYFGGDASAGNLREGVKVTTFAQSYGKWQYSFVSAEGASDTAFRAGTVTRAPTLGDRSQPLNFSYYDNTTTDARRELQLYADPVDAGATGASLVLGSGYASRAGLILANGAIVAKGPSTASVMTIDPIVPGSEIALSTNLNNGNATTINFSKARGGVIGAPTVITSGDDLGTIRFSGYDGSAYTEGAFILGDTSGVIGAGAIGGRLKLGTDGSTRLTVSDEGIDLSAYLSGAEQTAPAAPAANGYRIFAQDNGSGKTQLMVIFASGAAQQLAIQP